MHFANLDTFLREAPLNEASLVPIPVVAKWMRVTPPAVRAMLRRGALNPVSIGGVSFVSAQSLRDWQAELEADVRKTLKILRKAARKGRPIAYSTLLEKLGRSYTTPADRRRLGVVLNAASAQSFAEDGVLMAVWAQSKASEMPKHGVWELAEENGLRRDGEGPVAFLEAQRAASRPDELE